MPKITIYAAKDTFVCSDTNCTELNFGKQLNLIISPSNKALLYFDLSSIPTNAIITSAKLHLYLYRSPSANSDTCSINISNLKTDFYENTVTSHTSPASDPLLKPDASTINIDTTNFNNFITFDNLTNITSSWYDSSSTNHGFKLSTTSLSTLSFFSREYSEDPLHPHLEIEYTINNDIPFIETASSYQNIIFTNTPVVQTSVSDISKSLFFTYYIDNTISTPPYPGTDPHRPPLTSDCASIILQTCSTIDGTFENLGSEINISAKEIYSLPVSTADKYVRLSIKGTNQTSLDVYGIYKSFNPFIPSSVKSARIVGDTIILTMTKPLTSTIVDNDAFTLYISSGRYPLPPIKIIKTVISGTTITLTCSPNLIY